ncbi:RWP-RK domain-containing protein [Musa troglodytarum]|uniref:RWP-RK domain-containing protein n=1 Tax=Musa troglodytarum TaxID=320322 RepID=A0A9E7HCX5_9LILI|nr:RWP-RK domain-containing protein [Musa troglodytarum]
MEDSLSAQNLEWVKQFFLDYGLLRVRERYVMMQDSLSAFYDALCVPMSYEEEKVAPEPGVVVTNVKHCICLFPGIFKRQCVYDVSEGEDPEAAPQGCGELRASSHNGGRQGATNMPHGPQESVPQAWDASVAVSQGLVLLSLHLYLRDGSETCVELTIRLMPKAGSGSSGGTSSAGRQQIVNSNTIQQSISVQHWKKKIRSEEELTRQREAYGPDFALRCEK